MKIEKIIERLEYIYQVYPSGFFYPNNEKELDNLRKDVKDGNKFLSQLIKELKVSN